MVLGPLVASRWGPHRLKTTKTRPQDGQDPASRRLTLAKMSPKRHLRTHKMPEEASKVAQETFRMAQVAPERSPERPQETKFIGKTIVFL